MEKPEINHAQFLRSLPDVEQLVDDLLHVYNGAGKVSFLCYDITSLRKINHTCGRSVGDALLVAVAKWVGRFPNGHLYRVEGDLFCMLFPEANLGCVHHHASLLDARFGKVWQLEVDGRSTDIYTQAAIAVLGDLGHGYHRELPELFERALEISSKTRQVTLFDAEHDSATREHMRLQMELKTCILAGMEGFDVHFQPIADPITGTWRGLEALCRWTGPSIGPVTPGIFIAEAEEMGLIYQLGSWVLDTALGVCKAQGLDKLDRFFVSVNVSTLQLTKRNYVKTVLDIVERHDYPFGKLLLEITESTQFTFNKTTVSAIEMLRAKGVMFALDDFGSGYSGFSNLKNLPIDMLKTDREFIDNIENDNYLQYFYYIMSETAHANGMQLIAEGIENQDQLRSVVKNGADLVQGYLFGKPMDRDVLAARTKNFTKVLSEFSGWMSSLADFKQWLYGQNAYKITPSLFGLQSKCIGAILEEEDLEKAVHKTLEIVGAYFKVNHVFVFLREDDTVFSNTYEWCAPGVANQKHLFQQVESTMDGFYDLLCENEVVIARSAEQLPSNLWDRLEQGGQPGSIQSLVVMPMKQRDEILGFVGFDDKVVRDWMPEELIILHNLCLLCLIILAKKESS